MILINLWIYSNLNGKRLTHPLRPWIKDLRNTITAISAATISVIAAAARNIRNAMVNEKSIKMFGGLNTITSRIPHVHEHCYRPDNIGCLLVSYLKHSREERPAGSWMDSLSARQRLCEANSAIRLGQHHWSPSAIAGSQVLCRGTDFQYAGANSACYRSVSHRYAWNRTILYWRLGRARLQR